MMFRRVAIVAGVMGLAWGCEESSVARQGRARDVVATYRMGELSAEMPRGVGPLDIQAAAESSLRGRGYVVTESSGTRDRTRVVARANVDGRHEATSVESEVTAHGTLVRIESDTYANWGDEAASRAVLEAMLGRLGR